MILNGQAYTKKEDAGKMLLEICKNKESKEPEDIGEYRGMKMQLEIVGQDFILELNNNSSYIVKLGSDIHGNITRIDNVITDMSKKLEDNKLKLSTLKQQFENAKVDVKVPFDKEEELTEKTKRLNRLNKELEINEKENEIIDDEVEEQKEIDSKEKECPDYNKDDFR